MRRLIIAAFTLFPLSLSSVSAHAEVYRWVDENGVVNYSAQPPEGNKAQKVNARAAARPSGNSALPSPAPAPAADDATDEASELDDRQQKMLEELKAIEAQRTQEIADIRRANCEKSREVLDRLTQTDRIRIRNNDGSERIIGEDERQSRISEAQRGVASNC